MPPEDVQGVLGRAFSNFARDIDTAKTHLSRLAEGSVIVGAVRGMRPEDQAALATSMVPGVGDAAGLYADYTDIRENWDQVPWYDKAGMVGAAALGAVPFVPSRIQVNAGAEVAREMITPSKTIAYHGSPHDFPPVRELQMPDGARVYQSMDDAIPEGAKMLKEHPLGRFNMSKIGTGEGAQAYGHGLYFAEAEDVARGYRDQLADMDLIHNGEIVDVDPRGGKGAKNDFLQRLKKGMVREKTDYGNNSEVFREENVDDALSIMHADDELTAWAQQFKGGEIGVDPKGSMYQVEIDASPDEFLDWNLPLSKQSEQVKKAIGLDRSLLGEDLSKEAIYEYMKKTSGVDNSNLAEGISRFHLGEKSYLNGVTGEALAPVDAEEWGSIVAAPQGIKGIRYKDANSRGKEGGTSNYVVFDENLISIARKYGIAIPAAAAMLARQTGQNPQDLYEDDYGAYLLTQGS